MASIRLPRDPIGDPNTTTTPELILDTTRMYNPTSIFTFLYLLYTHTRLKYTCGVNYKVPPPIHSNKMAAQVYEVCFPFYKIHACFNFCNISEFYEHSSGNNSKISSNLNITVF